MDNAAILIEVFDTELGIRQEYSFLKTPVRIGRSPLNDLPLERPFVSHCHGVLHAEGAHWVFVDLGSTNGTSLRELRLPKHQPTALSCQDRLQIGSLELSVRRGEAAEPHTHASYAFRPSRMNMPVPAALMAQRNPLAPDYATQGSAPTPGATGDALSPLYAQYRAAWSALMSAIQTALPPGSETEAPVEELLRRFPELAQEAEFRSWLGTERTPSARAPERTEHRRLAALLQVPREYANSPGFAERVAAVVQRFAQAFLELRRGRRQFAREAALELTREPLEQHESARALLGYLLDPGAPSARIDELSRAYADLMLHQMALLSGLAAGARAALDEVSPHTLALRHRGPLHALLRLLGVDARWRTLERRHADLAEDSALSKVLMGKSFERAYAAVMGEGDPVMRGVYAAGVP